MEFSHFSEHLAENLPGPFGYTPSFQQYFKYQLPGQVRPEGEYSDILWQYADMLVVSLPDRYTLYEESDYSKMQLNILTAVDKIVSDLGAFAVQSHLPILQQMKLYSLGLILLSLIFSIIIILFVTISILLVYSLLMISIETKTFDNAVMRLVGLGKNSFVGTILLQSSLFVLPSIATSFILIFPILTGISIALDMGDDQKLSPTGSAITQSLLMGFGIPLLSAIIPIRSALNKNIIDSIGSNVDRNKTTKGSNVEITNMSVTNLIPYVTFGLLSVVYGVCIYYILPYSLLSGNYSIILWIFFMLMIGMILGLTIIAYNF
jgi:hypothetical protein